MTLSAPENQEINGKVKVICRTLHTIAHAPMVHARVLESHIHFSFMYMTYHIFPVLPIKYLINKDGKPTTQFKLYTGTKPSVSHLHVLLFLCVVRKATAPVDKKVLNMRHQVKKAFRDYLRWNSTASKRVCCVSTRYKEDIIFI